LGRLSYLILGPLEVRDGDAGVDLRGGQQRKLLAILLLHGGEAVTSDLLIEELWAGKPPETAAKALQGYISGLRKQLGPETVETVGAGYRSRVAPEDVDAHRFEELLAEARTLEPGPTAAKLRDALALWRGPALADFAYDNFARNKIDRLEELRLGCIERRVDLDLALGHHDDLVPELEALARTHPLRERLRGQLMLALYRSGRQAEALDAYHAARTALRDELGLEPSEELQGLQRAILAHDESLAAPPRVDRPRPPDAGRAPKRQRHPRIAIVIGLALLAGAALAIALTRGNGKAPPIVVPPNSVVKVDPAGMKTELLAGVGRDPVAIALGFRRVWVANAEDGTVTRLDPATGNADTIGAGGGDLNDIAVGFGFVWVANGNDGTITKIDPHLDQMVGQPIPLGPRTVRPDPAFYIAVDSRYVWVTRGNDLLRIDPTRDQVKGHVTVGTPTGLATGDGSVWVTTQSALLWRIDPRTLKGDSKSLLTLSPKVQAPVFARGSLWQIAYPDLYRIDPTTLSANVLSVPSDMRPKDLAWGSGALWSTGDHGRLTRLTPGGRPGTYLYIGGNLSAVAAGGGAIWVAVSGTN
jgi:DNA-binding SARP family transcriptional activator/streptogramin lyase